MNVFPCIGLLQNSPQFGLGWFAGFHLPFGFTEYLGAERGI
jgi:hypothetical protein